MDNEIKRLLKLENIPNFRLSDKERLKLAEWKANQVRVKPVKKKTPKIPKGYEAMEIGSAGKPTLRKVKNIVEKTTGEIEES